jgi:hypothetical protein
MIWGLARRFLPFIELGSVSKNSLRSFHIPQTGAGWGFPSRVEVKTQ